MKPLFWYSAVAIPLFALSGCATLDQAVKEVQKATAPTTITESLPKICQAAKENPVSANDLYVNKGLSISGKVSLIREGFQPRYRVLVYAAKIAVHAGTDNPLAVKQLSVGQAVRVSGVVTDVSYDFNGCSIALKDATF